MRATELGILLTSLTHHFLRDEKNLFSGDSKVSSKGIQAPGGRKVWGAWGGREELASPLPHEVASRVVETESLRHPKGSYELICLYFGVSVMGAVVRTPRFLVAPKTEEI